MAVSPESSLAFQREVDEELRREQVETVWRRYGVLLVTAIVLALAIFGGVLWWQHHREAAAGAEGERLQAAYDDLASGKIAAAGPSLTSLAASKTDGYRALAQFTQADLLLQKNDLKGAAAKLGALAADTSLSQSFRDLALVRQTSAEFDTLKPDVVVARLKPLAVKGNPWFGSAGEMVAIAYLRMNRTDLAGTLFGQIAQGDDVPASIRQRAVQMAGVLGVDAVAQNEGTGTR